MSEQNQIYLNCSSEIPNSIEGFKKLSSSMRFESGNYEPPTPKQIKALRLMLKMSQNDVAKLVGVTWNAKKGSSSVRKWETEVSSNEHRTIGYSHWRGLLLHAGVVDVF